MEIKFKLRAFIKKYTLGCKCLRLHFNLKFTTILLPVINYLTTSINLKKLAFFVLFIFFGLIEMKGQSSYTLVTSESQLTSGSKYIISSSGTDGTAVVMGYQNTNNRPEATSSATIASSLISATPAEAGTSDAAKPYELTLGGSTGVWTLIDINGVQISSTTGTSSNLLKNGFGTWAIIIATSGSAATMTCSIGTKNLLKYNSGSSLFSCYSSGQSSVYLYKLSASSPTISSLSPSSGCIGSSLTINGTNLTGATSVTIGGTPVSSITSNSSTQIVAVVGSGTTGTVSVTTPNGTATSVGQFNVNANPVATATNNGPFCAGATIQLTGGPSGLSSYSWSGPNSYSSIVTQNVNQDFDSLTGIIPTWTDNSTIANWYSQRTGTSTSYALNNGSDSAGELYSYGITTSASDRAIGTIGSGNAVAGSFAHGVLLQNTTGYSITNIKVSYTLEQWRNSAAPGQSITVYYQTSSSPITSLNPGFTAGWTQVTDLSLTSPVTGGTAGALDGNAMVNKVTASNISIPSLILANNDYIMLKWEDPDHTGSDHGLAIDNISIVLSAGNMSPLITNSTTAMSGNYILTTTNASGCTAMATTNVVVEPNPLTSNIYHE